MLTSSRFALAVLCVALVALESATANPLADAKPAEPAKAAAKLPAPTDDERLPFGPDGSLFLTGNQCNKDEELAPGHLPTCEPTCDDPKPICVKSFFSSLDYVPCFCKAPLVRNVKTEQCVQLSECPPKAKPVKSSQVRW